jgi:hypothetical protein
MNRNTLPKLSTIADSLSVLVTIIELARVLAGSPVPATSTPPAPTHQKETYSLTWTKEVVVEAKK